MSETHELTKVLVVDDDHAMTDLLRMALEADNFIVYTANSGSDGIEGIHNIDPDVVILDLLLPIKGGLSICREIRSFSQVPILILSVMNKPGVIEQALDAGADEYLLKPAPTNVLIAHLNTLARRARAEKIAAGIADGSQENQYQVRNFHPQVTK